MSSQEDWETIEEFPRYSISSQGRVMNVETQRILKLSRSSGGTPLVGLKNYGEQQRPRLVATLVADAFLQDQKSEVYNTPINLNGDRLDCRVSNLMWRPRFYAIKYHRQFSTPGWNRPNTSVPIMETTTKTIFQHTHAAGIYYGFCESEFLLSVTNKEHILGYPYLFQYLLDYDGPFDVEYTRGDKDPLVRI